MSDPLSDQRERDRFRDEWARNFAVSANAGSGKTTAISERLAGIALAEGGAEVLRKTAVVTFTKKAAAQIGQRARAVLVRRLAEAGRTDLAPLDQLERAFFGTIHSFCLLLAQRYGQTLGLHLNPTVIEGAEMEEALWEEFLEQDAMKFTALAPAQVGAFLRHVSLDSIFELAREMDHPTARRLVKSPLAGRPPEPATGALAAILAATTKGTGAKGLAANQALAQDWLRRFHGETGFLPLPKPQGTAAGIVDLFADLLAPLKGWLADAGAVLASELALRYRTWRFNRGVQTYSDQVESAVAVLQDTTILERIRQEGWRIVLDEAQDTDPHQFAVLAEIARPPGAPLGTWPGAGPGPRAGHFSLVGDGQQSIYGSRADVRNFQRHVAAFGSGDGGEKLVFGVTFRTPREVIPFLNRTLSSAFGSQREHNVGLPAGEGAPAPQLQVDYESLVGSPRNEAGRVAALRITPATAAAGVDARLANEVRQVAAWLKAGGPAAVGARRWGDICVLAPRNDWLVTARREFEAAGLRTALQMRKNRNGDNPVYAWLTGLLAVVCDPENTFEWVGVLREIFAVSDADIARALAASRKFEWDRPEAHAGALGAALAQMKPLVERADHESEPLERFAHELAGATGLAGKARSIDPSGGLNGELERLLAQAAELGVEGAGPRTWRVALLAGLEAGRPSGKAAEDAINLLTSHSAKGLEWPVVIPIGLWRQIVKRNETGMRLLSDASGMRVFFDHASVPDAIRVSRERERLRELVRLLYVTLTRPRQALILPAGEPVDKGSLLELWGADLGGLPGVPEHSPQPDVEAEVAAGPTVPPETPAPKFAIPRRILPHQLAHKPDLVRASLHEADDETAPVSREDPIDYGIWWHESVEFFPWSGGEQERDKHLATATQQAAQRGFGERAQREIALLRASSLWREFVAEGWVIYSELSVVAPLGDTEWVDGVIDLVAQKRGGAELLVVDWKTNQRRRGESGEQLIARLMTEYRPQLQAYASCLGRFFPGKRIRWGVYATATGRLGLG
jgi:ATP-dependent exoDNAse (exonuclease V) beta subunit